MTTINITGQKIQYGFVGLTLTPTAVSSDDVTIAFEGDVTDFSYTVAIDNTPSTLDEVTLDDPFNNATFTSGTLLSDTKVFFGTVTWDDSGTTRTTTVLVFGDQVHLSSTYFRIDGDALPTFTTPADASAWSSSVISWGDATGAFAPGGPIAFSSIGDLGSTTETDTLVGSSGSDTLNGGSADDTISGDDGNDTLLGEDGNDTLYGGLGRDTLIGGAGDDTLNGGDGSDYADYSSATGGINAYLNFGIVSGADGNDTLVSIEKLKGTDYADRLIGDAASNVIYAGDGDDIIKTKGGDDAIFGGAGNDIITGAGGDEGLAGQAGADIIFGNAGDDHIFGGDGNDYLYGGRDNDTLRGDDGDDVLKGNRGVDLMNGDAGNDKMYGGGQNDTMEGGTGNDYLYGEGGDDLLSGGDDNDSMTGGAGADTFYFTNSSTAGYDRVKDFEDGIDQINLSSFSLASFTDVSTLTTEISSGVKINFGGGNVLLLEGMALADFDASDVIL